MSCHKAQAFWETSSGLGRQIQEKEGITRNEKWAKQEVTKEEAVVVSVGLCANFALVMVLEIMAGQPAVGR